MADEANQLRVRLVTPERTLFEHAAAAVELPSKSGYMEVLYGQQALQPGLQPGGAFDALAFGTVPVAAGVVRDPRVAAAAAGIHVPSQSGRAAGDQAPHHRRLQR